MIIFTNFLTLLIINRIFTIYIGTIRLTCYILYLNFLSTGPVATISGRIDVLSRFKFRILPTTTFFVGAEWWCGRTLWLLVARRRGGAHAAGRKIECGTFRSFLLLYAPILEPNLYLFLRQTQSIGDLNASQPWQICIEGEFTLEL